MKRLFFVLLALASVGQAHAAGDLSRQDPIEVVVELGRPGAHAFFPSRIELETGKLYKLVLTNKSEAPHYFTSHDFSQRIFTRKVQVVSAGTDNSVLAEFKGAIREIEVYPGQTAEWWLVPVATGRVTDLHCGVRDKDGKTHAEHGMTGEIIIR
ncbi:MAG: hypothetical protein AVDCRST_MAG90-2267 [uncultured Microvirga sp.]|uniref:Biphenyl 2,3-dioxygenase n=1 Tax=uncultured Microvirga sp. TaxID=412392 RepID=A0A6J4M3G1_9HYPH|nr:MAG: hypothetical protein AVDCRST_MAG90-2267 [uncultured Microvirga sp.]